jgi:hypothetical protein
MLLMVAIRLNVHLFHFTLKGKPSLDTIILHQMDSLQPTSQTPQQLPSLITEAVDLMEQGRHQEAAELLIAHERAKLPEGHPSKGELKGIMQGETVSQFAKFEEQKILIGDVSKFMTVMLAYHNKPEDLHHGVMNYFGVKRPDLLSSFANYLLELQADEGQAEILRLEKKA